MHTPATNILSRPRVNRQLDQIFDYPLTVVRAPVGFGKTTALREYLRTRGIAPIWLSLPSSGGSPAYCWDRLAVQIGKKNAALGSRLARLGFPTDAPALAKIVELVCRADYPAPVVLVVDDYHRIDCRRTADLIARIAAERTANLHLVLLTGDAPVLPVADLEQRGLCLLMGQETLQFHTGEIREYFALMGCPTSEETLQYVSRRTVGWIFGVYLHLLGIGRNLPPGGGADVGVLLERNLYSAYDAETQDFLLRLSLLDAVTPEQAAWVLEDDRAGRCLLTLAQDNAFICYNHALAAYEMADLLRDFLREKARLAGVDPKPIWRRMGQWFLAREEGLSAYDYLCRAEDFEAILRDLDSDTAKDIYFTQLPKLQQLFERLPAETAFRYPLAVLRHIGRKALTCPPAGRDDLARRLRDMERHFLDAKDLPEETRTRVLGEIHSVWTLVAFNDARQTVEHAEQAAAHLNGRYSRAVGAGDALTRGAPHLLYCYYNEQGSLRERGSYLSTHFHVLARVAEGWGAGSEPLALAEYALETGDFDHVELPAQEAIDLSRRYDQTSVELCATFTLARLALIRGRYDRGAGMLAALAERVGRRDSSALNTAVELCQAYVNSCYGKAESVPLWLRENDMGADDFQLRGVAFPYVVCMRAVLLSGAFVRLEVLCREFRQKFTLYHNCLGLIHNDICAAVAKERLYGIEAGCGELERALIQAAADNVVLPFGENAMGILPMLRKMRCSKKVPQAFLEQVTDCCERYQRGVSGQVPSAVTLTEREKEILRMLARGAKHEEVAAALNISVPTVRYHVKNAYHKLEVNNKGSALQKAKSLNLI